MNGHIWYSLLLISFHANWKKNTRKKKILRHYWLQSEVSILWKLVDQKHLSPCRPCAGIRFKNASWNDIKLMPEPYFITWLRHIRSGSKEKFSFKSSGTVLIPCALFQLMDIYFFFFSEVGRGVRGSWKPVVVEEWRSLVTLHVPVCVRLHLRLSSHLTGLSVSTADQNTSLSLTGWTDSAAIQTDSSSGSWWRGGGREGGICGREARQRLLRSKRMHTQQEE